MDVNWKLQSDFSGMDILFQYYYYYFIYNLKESRWNQKHFSSIVTGGRRNWKTFKLLQLFLRLEHILYLFLYRVISLFFFFLISIDWSNLFTSAGESFPCLQLILVRFELMMVLTAVIWATEQTPAPLQESPEQLFTSKHLNKTTSVSGYDSAYVLTQNTIKHESQLAS